MSFPRYNRYKESGVEWLGEVPEGWKMGNDEIMYCKDRNKVLK